MIEIDPATGFRIFRPDGKTLRAFLRDRTSRVKVIQGPQGSGTSSACCQHIYHAACAQPRQHDGKQRYRAHIFRECYDDQTEILTERRGWQLFRNLLSDDKVAQLNGDQLEFVLPQEHYAAPYVGEMIGYEGEGVDFLVTPDHLLWVSPIHGRAREWLPFRFEQAKDVYGKDVRVRRDAEWAGEPSRHSPAMYEWLGFWFAEGCGNTYRGKDGYARKYLALTQCKPDGIEYSRQLFAAAGIPFSETCRPDGGVNFRVLVRPETAWLFTALTNLGGALQKTVPAWMKAAPAEHLRAFIKGFVAGDGCTSNGTTKAYTSSKLLADDLQEMALKAGTVANVAERPAIISLAANALGIYSAAPSYSVTFVGERRSSPRLNEKYKPRSLYRGWHRKPYAGHVYCVVVPTHIIYVRRNGRAFWASNTYSKIEETALRTWLDWFPPKEFGRFYETRPYQHEIRVGPLELDVIFMAMDDIRDAEAYFKSLETSLIWFNEGQFAQFPVIREAAGRQSPPRYPAVKDGGCEWGGMIIDTNAPPADHWIPIMRGDTAPPDWMTESQRNSLKKPDNWTFYTQPAGLLEDFDDRGTFLGYRPNPEAENLKYLHKPGVDPMDPAQNFYMQKIGAQTKQWIDSNIMNRSSVVVDGKPVYPMFRRDVHVSDRELIPIKDVPVTIGIDPSGKNPAALIGQQLRGDWFVQREFLGVDCFLDDFAPQLKNFLAQTYPGFTFNFWGAPDGGWGGTSKDDTPFMIFRKHRMNVLPTWDGQNRASVRQEAMNAVLMRRSSTGRASALLVDPRCVTFITGMSGGYHMRRIRVSGERYADEPEKNQYSHVCEAGEQLVMGGGEGRGVMGVATAMKPLTVKRSGGAKRRVA